MTQELIILLKERVVSVWLAASIGAFQRYRSEVGIEGCMKVIAVARWALDIDSL